MKKYREAVNTDAEMEVIGEWFSNDFKISFEGADFLISVRRGKIIEIAENPRFDRPVAFTLRAPMSCGINSSTRPRPHFTMIFSPC